jgi:hypothetical protein
VIDRVFPFESTNEALAYLEAGRAKGKVVVKMRNPGSERTLRRMGSGSLTTV